MTGESFSADGAKQDSKMARMSHQRHHFGSSWFDGFFRRKACSQGAT
jgi:hypothetical protein